ncbi:type II secretion system protein [Megalodesulfovibrio paquesii]
MYSIRTRRKSELGFTLMELLVVLVILGFLLGMVLPRLGSITDSAVDTVCDSNNKGIRYFTKLYLDQKGRLPNNLTNLVHTDTTAAASTTTTTSGTETVDGIFIVAGGMTESDPVEGTVGELHPDFVQRNGYGIRALQTGEAAELKTWGISTVRDYIGANEQPMASNTLADGDLVASVGGAMPATAADITTGINSAAGNPFWYGRIMLGVSDVSSLVTEGFIQAAALCPGGIQNADTVKYNNYVLILPRTEAYVAALEDIATGTSTATRTVQEATDVDGDGVVETGEETANGRQETFDLTAQEKWNFDLSCPEGHKWPDNDNDYWISI